MARMGNRVTQVANAEAENSEDLEFKSSVSRAAVGVSDSKTSILLFSGENLVFRSFLFYFYQGKFMKFFLML